MALERDQEGENPGADNNGGVRDKLHPERQRAYDDVLAGLESGQDDPAAAKKGRKSPPAGKGAGAGKRSSAARSAPAPSTSEDDGGDDPEELLLDDEDDGDSDESEEPTKPEKRKPPARPAQQDDDDESDDEDESFVVESADDDEDDEDDDDAPADAEDDDADEDDEDAAATKTAVQRGLKKLADKERRQKQQQAEWRATFEREKAEHWRELQPHVESTREWLAIKHRASSDKVGAAMQFAEKVLQLSGDDWRAVSKQFFLRSPEAATQPGAAAEAARLRSETETRGKTEELERKLAAVTSRLEEKEADEQARRQTRGYLNRVVGSVDADTPLVRRLLRRAPESTRDRLHELAAELIQRSGETPTPRKLLRALERRERQLLRERGIDPDKISKKGAEKVPAAAKTKAGQKKPAKAKTNGSGGPVAGRDLRHEVLEGLRGLDD